jgi:hypothetical protein
VCYITCFLEKKGKEKKRPKKKKKSLSKKIIDSDDTEPDFWGPLGGFYAITYSTPPGSLNDAAIKQEEEGATQLYRVKESGEIVKVPELPLVPTLLDSNSCFILGKISYFLFYLYYTHCKQIARQKFTYGVGKTRVI